MTKPSLFLFFAEKKYKIRKLALIMVGFWLSQMLTIIPTAKAADTNLGKFGVWQAYAYQADGDPVCVMWSSVGNSRIKIKTRDKSLMFVTNRPADARIAEVSLQLGLALSDDKANVYIDNKLKYKFYPAEESLFAEPGDDDALLADLIRKNNLRVKAKAKNGQAIDDEFSLQGFQAALKAINKACAIN